MPQNGKSKKVHLTDEKYCEWCEARASIGLECQKKGMGTGIWLYACSEHVYLADRMSLGRSYKEDD